MAQTSLSAQEYMELEGWYLSADQG
jgi:hypothetical protein